MTTRKRPAGSKKLKVKKQTLKDLAPKGGKIVAGRVYVPLTSYCTGVCRTAMTNCGQLTCKYYSDTCNTVCPTV